MRASRGTVRRAFQDLFNTVCPLHPLAATTTAPKQQKSRLFPSQTSSSPKPKKITRSEAKKEEELNTFTKLTVDYLNNKHADIEPEPSPKTYYCEYANLRNTPGRCVEPDTETQTLALIDEVADAPPRPNVTSWFHIEGVNDAVLREFFARVKLNTGAPSNGGARRGGGKNGDDAVALFFKRHREPRLRFFGTHMYVAMQLLDRNDSEGDIPMVSDQQVSALFIPNRRILLTVSEYASPGTDFDRMRETLVQGSSACNHPNADATLLLAVLADKFMEDSFPLAEELGDYLELLAHALIMKPGLRYNIPADKVRTELWRMRRFALRTRRLTEILAEDPLQLFENARFRSFVAVVERQSSSLAELCGMHNERCGDIMSRIEVHQTHKTNETLFTLTILTALIIPVQFLTGVYGMNFENMPELRTTYGYYVFWAAVPTLCTFTYLMLRRKGLIEDDSDIRITQLMPTEVVSAVSFISKRAKRRMRQVGVGAAYVAGGMAKGAKKAGGAVHVTIKSASPRFSGSGGGGGSSTPPTPKDASA